MFINKASFKKTLERIKGHMLDEVDLSTSVSDAFGLTKEDKLLDFAEIAHEIKTPLTTALYSTDLLKGNYSLVKKIKLSLEHIQSIIDNNPSLLKNNDIGKICKEAAVISGESERVIIKDMIKKRFIVNPKNVTKIRQIYIILISNALKYSYNKSKVYVNLYEGENQIISEIISNGYTIEKQEWQKIFLRGKRLSNSIDKPGSGLGLSIAYRLSRKVNSKLKVLKSENDQTVFEFKIYT